MLARLQKLIVVSLIAFIALVAGASIAFGHPTWAPAGAFAVAAVYVAVLGAEFSALYRSFDKTDPDRPAIAQLLRAWWLECVSTPTIFLWQQPFRSAAEADGIVPTSRTHRRGVVLVHGYVCNRGIWNAWMRRLRSDGVSFIAVDLEPPFGSIDGHVTTIDDAVSTLERSAGHAPVIVAHSMGGLAARVWAANRGGASRCHALVTIGTPHRGTRMANTASTRNGREMRVGSAWLGQLESLEATTPAPRRICFWGHCDNIVFPSRNATLPSADNRHLEATPHVQMIFHPAVMAEVLRLVDEPAATASPVPEQTSRRSCP